MKKPNVYINAAASCSLLLSSFSALGAVAQPAQPTKKSLALLPMVPLVTPPRAVPVHSHVVVSKRSLRRKALAAYPSTHYQKGHYFKQKGDHTRALVEFLKATQENPRLVRAFYEQALIFRERGYLKLAQSSLEQALAAKPDYHEARILLATLQIEQGNVGAAMQQLGQSLGISLIGTRNGDNKGNGGTSYPLPMVLQSLHAIIPESSPAKPAVKSVPPKAKPAPVSKPSKKAGENSFKLKPYPSRSAKGEAEIQSDAVPAPKPETADASVPKESEKKASTDSKNSDAIFGLHILNPLHMFWPGTKSSDEEKKDEPINLATTSSKPTEEHKTTPEKPRKRSSKSWLSRWFGNDPSAEQDQDKTASASKSQQNKSASGQNTELETKDNKDSELTKALAPAAPESEKKTAVTVDVAEKVSEKTNAAEPAVPPGAVAVASGKTFQIPPLPTASSPLFTPLHNSVKQQEEETSNKPQIAPNSDDPWSVRLRYLADHGTGTLKDGEAFMFSEESGEATLFLADGQTVRRTIYLPRDAQEVVRQRRPDILAPDDLMYNLSLLAKLMPKQDEAASANKMPDQSVPNFNVDNIMGKSQGFWGWLKNTLKL